MKVAKIAKTFLAVERKRRRWILIVFFVPIKTVNLQGKKV
jgi:hypothetical protein